MNHLAKPIFARGRCCSCGTVNGVVGAGNQGGAGELSSTSSPSTAAPFAPSPAGAGSVGAAPASYSPQALRRANYQRNQQQKAAEMNARRERHEREQKPTYFVYRCNGAKDCLSGESWQGPLPGSLMNAYAWVKPDAKRVVDVYDQPGGALLAHVVNTSMGDTRPTTTDQVELEQRKLASREILGKI